MKERYSIFSFKHISFLAQTLAAKGYDTVSFHGFKPEFYNRDVMHKSLGSNNLGTKKISVLDDLAGWNGRQRQIVFQTVA